MGGSSGTRTTLGGPEANGADQPSLDRAQRFRRVSSWNLRSLRSNSVRRDSGSRFYSLRGDLRSLFDDRRDSDSDHAATAAQRPPSYQPPHEPHARQGAQPLRETQPAGPAQPGDRPMRAGAGPIQRDGAPPVVNGTDCSQTNHIHAPVVYLTSNQVINAPPPVPCEAYSPWPVVPQMKNAPFPVPRTAYPPWPMVSQGYNAPPPVPRAAYPAWPVVSYAPPHRPPCLCPDCHQNEPLWFYCRRLQDEGVTLSLVPARRPRAQAQDPFRDPETRPQPGARPDQEREENYSIRTESSAASVTPTELVNPIAPLSRDTSAKPDSMDTHVNRVAKIESVAEDLLTRQSAASVRLLRLEEAAERNEAMIASLRTDLREVWNELEARSDDSATHRDRLEDVVALMEERAAETAEAMGQKAEKARAKVDPEASQ